MGEQQEEEGEQIPELEHGEITEEQQPPEDDQPYNNSSWPPAMRFDIPPYKTHHFSRQFRASSNPNNFLKCVRWSPDGSGFLTSTDDNTLHLFTLPECGNGMGGEDCPSAASEDSFPANLAITEGEAIYDYCWYPYMSTSDPVSCVFASTTRDHPIHLWDATSGQLRCTYRAYDAMDEITAAFSIAFNPTGTKIFAGYNKCIRIFDIHRPGRDFGHHSTIQGNKEGQSGIISSIAFSPSHTGMLATGSYSQTTAIHREDNIELLYVLRGQEGGVTHVQFSRDGNYLYTGGRKDPYILCWDIRKTVEIVYKLYRSSETTNQRIQFDTEPYGGHLGTGGQDGLVHIYDLQTGQWVSSFQAASDTVSGFSFHPFLPMAATSSGHRRFGALDDSDEDFSLRDDENCASVWSFSTYPAEDFAGSTNPGDLNGQLDKENSLDGS